MFSTLTDRPAKGAFSPRETDSETNGGKRRRIESTDDHPRPRQTPSSSSQPSADVRDDDYDDDVLEAPAKRILTTRYLLTTTGYKYLAIGVAVKPPSYVDIVLGDKQGREISLSLDAWKGLVERKRDVVASLRVRFVDENHPPSPISIGDLTLRFGWINNLSIVRFELPKGARLAMSLNTLLSLYDHRFCVDRVVSALSNVTEEVDAKYSRYREIAANATKTGISAKAAILKSDFFDPNNIVDCEITALCFKS